MIWSYGDEHFLDPAAPGLTPAASEAAKAALAAKAEHEAHDRERYEASEALKRAPEEDARAELDAQLAGKKSPTSTRGKCAAELDAATKRAEGSDRLVRERLTELSRLIAEDKEAICEAARERVAAQEARAGRLIAELREVSFDIEADRGRQVAFERTNGHPVGAYFTEPNHDRRAALSAKVATSFRGMPKGNNLVDRKNSDTLLAALEALLIPVEQGPIQSTDPRSRTEGPSPVEAEARLREGMG